MKKFYLTVAMAVAMLNGHAQEARYADFAFDFFDKVSAQTPDNNVSYHLSPPSWHSRCYRMARKARH